MGRCGVAVGTVCTYFVLPFVTRDQYQSGYVVGTIMFVVIVDV